MAEILIAENEAKSRGIKHVIACSSEVARIEATIYRPRRTTPVHGRCVCTPARQARKFSPESSLSKPDIFPPGLIP